MAHDIEDYLSDLYDEPTTPDNGADLDESVNEPIDDSIEPDQNNEPAALEPKIDDMSMFGEDDPDSTPDDAPLEQSDLINSLLEAKGITDALVKFENDNGEIEEVDFYELSFDEQLAILKSDDSEINYGLNDSEIDAVNFLRKNDASLEDVIEYFKREAVKEYIDSQSLTGFDVSQYTDEELFAIDLKSRYEDLSEEEIQLAVQKQLEHPDVFKKQVDKLREYYTEIEQEQAEIARRQEEEAQIAELQELQDNLISVAESVEDIGGLDLEINDKNEVLTYILNRDINGQTALDKALKDPTLLFQVGWFLSKGEEAFNILHNYYKKEIQDISKNSFEKGKAEALKQNTSSNKKSHVRRGQQPQGNKERPMHIDDLIID